MARAAFGQKRSRRLADARRLCVLTASAFVLSGCLSQVSCIPSHCGGPDRLIAVDLELAPIKELYNYPTTLQSYHSASSAQEAMDIRNEFIFERTYATDVNYTAYEEALTRESEDEGFLAAVTNAALTGTGALIPAAQTTRLLSAVAAGMTTVDQAYNKQYLLNKAVQVLQSQMRAKRADVLTHIIARTEYPVSRYPLGMAMSDLEQYYQAGTLSAAFIDLTEATATKADNAKKTTDSIKPGSPLVAQAVRAALINDVNAQIGPVIPVPGGPKQFGPSLSTADIGRVRVAMCLPKDGNIDPDVINRVSLYFTSINRPFPGHIDAASWAVLNARLIVPNHPADCSLFPKAPG